MTKAADLAPDELARACADAMWASDASSQAMGMEIVHIAAGEADITMPVRKDMTNGHGICHGGVIFTLADSAFAFACNGYNQSTVAQHCTISFLAAGHEGDRLTAKARERYRMGRSGVYDVTITNQNGETIAEFRGNSRTIRGTHLQD